MLPAALTSRGFRWTGLRVRCKYSTVPSMEIKSCTVPIFILLALRERLYPVKVRGLTWPDRLDRAEASSMIHKARVCGLLVMKPEYLAFIDGLF